MNAPFRDKTARAVVNARDRRALWLGALIVIPALLWRVAVVPYREALGRGAARATAARELLSREKALLRDAPRLPALMQASAARADDESTRLFGGADTVAATAALASWVRNAAVGAGLRAPQAAAAAVDIVAGGVESVAVDVRAEGPFAAVTMWIGLMESGERLLWVERLELSTTGATDGTVSLSARVLGYTAPFSTAKRGRRR